MNDFKSHYRTIFRTFGYPLGKTHAMTRTAIDKAAASLEITIPVALLEFYLVAGREKRFNRCHNRLLPPSEWRVSRNRLIFIEENQCLLWWAVSLGTKDNLDPPVSQAMDDGDDDELEWYREHRSCSTFLSVMLHLHAVNGGFRYDAQYPEPPNLKKKLKATWQRHGTVNQLTAYSRQNQVLCVEPDMGAICAAKTKKDLQDMETDLSLSSLQPEDNL